MNPTSRIECGRIHRVGLWSEMVNQGRILRINENLLLEKSTAEIEEVIKPMMVKHYNNASGNYKNNELKSYIFYDLCGNTTKYLLEELGLAVTKGDGAKEDGTKEDGGIKS
jgi:hypothetical protein